MTTKQSVTPTVEKITPEVAEGWLKNNRMGNNRRVRQSRVDYYAKKIDISLRDYSHEIKSDKWRNMALSKDGGCFLCTILHASEEAAAKSALTPLMPGQILLILGGKIPVENVSCLIPMPVKS